MSDFYYYIDRGANRVTNLKYEDVNDFIKNDIKLLKTEEVEIYQNSPNFFSEVYGKEAKKKLDEVFKKNKLIFAENYTALYEVKKGKIKYSKNKIQEKLKTVKDENKKNLLLEELQIIIKKEQRLRKKQQKINNSYQYEEGISDVWEKIKDKITKWSQIPGKILKIVFHKKVLQLLGIALAAVGLKFLLANPATLMVGIILGLLVFSYKMGGQEDPIKAFKWFKTAIADPIKDKAVNKIKSAFDKAAEYFKRPGVTFVVRLLLLAAKIVLSIAVNPIAFLVQFFTGLLLKSCIDTSKAAINLMKSIKEKNKDNQVTQDTVATSENFMFNGVEITPLMAKKFLSETEELKKIYIENLHNNVLKDSVFLKENNFYFEASVNQSINNAITNRNSQNIKLEAVVISHKINSNTKIDISLSKKEVSIKQNGKKIKRDELAKIDKNLPTLGDSFHNLNLNQIKSLIDNLNKKYSSDNKAENSDQNSGQNAQNNKTEEKNINIKQKADYLTRGRDVTAISTTLNNIQKIMKGQSVEDESLAGINKENANELLTAIKDEISGIKDNEIKKQIVDNARQNNIEIIKDIDIKNEKPEEKPEQKEKPENKNSPNNLYAIITKDSTLDNLSISENKPSETEEVLGYIALTKKENSNPNSKQYAADIYVKRLFDFKTNKVVNVFFEEFVQKNSFLKINSEPADILVDNKDGKYSLSMKSSVGNFFSRESNSTKKGKIDNNIKEYLDKTVNEIKERSKNFPEYQNSKKQSTIDSAIDEIIATNLGLKKISDDEIKTKIREIEDKKEEEENKGENKGENKDESSDAVKAAAEEAIKQKSPFLEDEVALGTILFIVISSVAFSYHFFTGGLSNIPIADPTILVNKVEVIIEKIASGQAYSEIASFLNKTFDGSAGANMSSGTKSMFDKLFSKVQLTDTSDVDSGMLSEMDPSLKGNMLEKANFLSENEELMSKLVVGKLEVKTFSEVLEQNPDFDITNYINGLSPQEFAEITQKISESELKEILNSPFGDSLEKGIIAYLKEADPATVNTFNEKFASTLENSDIKEAYAEIIKNKLAENDYYQKFNEMFIKDVESKGIISWFKEKIGMGSDDVEGTALLKSILKEKYDKIDFEELSKLSPQQQYFKILQTIKQTDDQAFYDAYVNNAEKLNQYPELKKMVMDSIMDNSTLLKKIANEQLETVLKDYDTNYIKAALEAKAKALNIPGDKSKIFIENVIKSIKDPNDPFFKSANDDFQKKVLKCFYNKDPNGMYIARPDSDSKEALNKLLEERYNFVASKNGMVPDNTWTGKMLAKLKDGDVKPDVKPEIVVDEKTIPNTEVTTDVKPLEPTPNQPESTTTTTDKKPPENTNTDEKSPENTNTDKKPPENANNNAQNDVQVDEPVLSDNIMNKLSNLSDDKKEQLVRTAKFFKDFSSNTERKITLIKALNKELGDNNITNITPADADRIINELQPSSFKKAINSVGDSVSSFVEKIKDIKDKIEDDYQYKSKEEEFLFNEYFKLENRLKQIRK